MTIAVVIAASVIVVGSAHLFFGDYFPGPFGLGHDYSFHLPDLLANYYWARAGGPWSPPWFTAAFCGGQPAFPDPQSIYYSLPQALVAFLDPVKSVYVTLLFFLGLGFVGAYLFLRRSLGTSVAASLVGATVFALNGFYSHRMLIGHLTVHSIMLVPWLALALTIPAKTRRIFAVETLLWGAGGALILANWIVGGMAVLVIPALLAVLALVLIHGLAGGSLREVSARAAVAVPLGLALSASKVAAVLAYIHNFPRTGYLLPGMSDVAATLKIAVTALFLAPANIALLAAENMANVQWPLDRHEWEYGVTPVPLLLIGCSLVVWLWRRGKAHDIMPRRRTLGIGTALFLLLSLPIAANTYDPDWNAFLKSLPVVGSASNLFRWFFIYIPVVAVLSALAIDSLPLSTKARIVLAVTAFVAVIGSHGLTDRRFYAQDNYDPRTVRAAFARARAADFEPAIRFIGSHVDARGRRIISRNNDLLTQGISQMGCYNPIFGYRLEFLPFGSLHPGDALEAHEGYLNVKDPACYVFPAENRCVPGAHFPVERRQEAERFLRYQDFSFDRSVFQQTADLVNRIALVVVPGLIIGGVLLSRAQRRNCERRTDRHSTESLG